MSSLTFLRQLKAFSSSLFFLVSVALLSILTWGIPGNFAWIPASFFILLSFLPLLSMDGRGYMALIFFVAISDSIDVRFSQLPAYIYAMGGAVLLSIVIFLFVKRMPLHKGALTIPLCILFMVFLVSYLLCSIREKEIDTMDFLYLVFFFAIVLIYVLFNTCLRREDTILYFAKTASILAVTVAVQIAVFMAQNGFVFGPSDFSLGWAYTAQTASTLLCLTLPFFSMLIARKMIYWLPLELFVYFGIIALSVDSGLLVVIFSVVPSILLAFRTYGKAYPYISLTLLVCIGIVFVGLMIGVERFSDRVLLALESLDVFHPQEWRGVLFDKAVADFGNHYVIGPSISGFLHSSDGNIILSSNTVLSTMTMGGSLGLAAFVAYEIVLYVSTLQKRCEERWLFLVFLLTMELIGLIDNTIYNFMFLLFLLLAHSCYRISNRPDDVEVHEEYYRFGSGAQLDC